MCIAGCYRVLNFEETSMTSWWYFLIWLLAAVWKRRILDSEVMGRGIEIGEGKRETKVV
jgi:hypothetical protein